MLRFRRLCRFLAVWFGVIAILSVNSASAFASEKPEIFVQLGHSGYINSIVFSPDGRYVLSGGDDKVIKLWETATGKEIATLRGHRGSVTQIIFSSDGKFVLSKDDVFEGRSLLRWDIFTGKVVKKDKILPSKSVFSSDGKYIVGGDERDNIGLWDTVTGKKIKALNYNRKLPGYDIEAISLSGNNRYAVSSHLHGILRVWDLASGKFVREIKNSTTEQSHYIATSHTGRFFLTAGRGKDEKRSLLLWDREKGKPLRTVHTYGSGNPAFGIFSPDEKYILFSKSNYEKSEYFLCLEELETGREVWCSEGHYIISAAFAPDGISVITGGGDRTLKLWDIATGKNIRTFSGDITLSSFGYSPRNNRMLAGSSIWDISVGKISLTIPDVDAAYLMLSPDGQSVLAKEQKLLFNIETGKWTEVFPEEQGDVNYKTVFSPDGRYILHDFEGTLKLWDIGNAKTVRIFKAHDNILGADAVTFSPDGKFILSAGWDNKQSALKLWDANNGRNRWTVKLGNINASSLAFSPDGKYILLCDRGNDRFFVLYNAADGRKIKEFKYSDLYRSRIECVVAFSPDGKYALSADLIDNRVILWDIGTGKEVKIFEGHSGGVASIAFLQDGKQFLSKGYDGTTRLWDISAGKELAQFINFTGDEWVVITPEGYFNASENGDKHLNVRIGNTVYGIDQYREAFYRPDLVTLALAGGSLKDFRKFADVKQPPTVSIVDTPKNVDGEEATVKVKIVDIGGGIGDVRLYLNGSAVVLDSSRGVMITSKDDKAVYKTYTVKLTSGLNTIRAIVFNGDNTMQSNDALHEITSAFKSLTKPSLYALVVGINEFKNPKLKLNYSVADAELFAETLGKGAIGLFEKVNIKKLVTQEETTNENIIKELRTFQSLNPDDLFVFFVASHGTVDDGEYFLITSNVGSTRTEKLKTDAISQTMFKELISNIPATKKLILLDTCNAGALGDAIQVAMLTRGMSEDTAMKVLSRAVGSTILSASTSIQEALEGYQGHGLFTFVLAEGLSGKADKGRTGYIKTTELADYVDSEVPVLAEKVFKKAQYPTISISGQGFPVVKTK